MRLFRDGTNINRVRRARFGCVDLARRNVVDASVYLGLADFRSSPRVRHRVTRLEFDAVRGRSFNAIAQRVCAIWVRARGVELPFSQDAIAAQVVHDLCADDGFLLGGVSGFGVRRTRVVTTSMFGGVVCVSGPGSLFKAPWGVSRRHNEKKGGRESKRLLALKVDGGGNGWTSRWTQCHMYCLGHARSRSLGAG